MLEQMAQMERQRELQRLLEAGGELPEAPLPGSHQLGSQQREPEPLLTFTPSVELDELVRPVDR